MGKIIVSMAISLDGYIAKHNGDTTWLHQAMVPTEDFGFAELMSNIGAYILGATTYREITKMGAGGGDRQVPTYVVTHQQDLKLGRNTYGYAGDLTALVQRLQAQIDKDIWLFGGGDLITQGLNLNLVEELNLMVVPVLLGDGVRLFGTLLEQKSLTLVQCQAYPQSGLVALTYRLHAVTTEDSRYGTAQG